MLVHTEEKPFKCEICSHGARNLVNLRKHQVMHSTEKSFSCNYCTYRAKYPQSIKLHVKNVHPESSFLYRCPLCQFKTGDTIRRDKHIKAHEENIHFTCNVCEKVLYDKRDLKDHERNHKVPKQKNITCLECGDTFYTQARLRRHTYKHTGQKEFRCRICGLECVKIESMERHFGKLHPSEKIFYCDVCNFYTNNLREKNKHCTSLFHIEKFSASK